MPGHDDYLDFNMLLTAQGELNRIEKKKPKVYAWDTSAKKEQKKLEKLETEIQICKIVLGD